MGSPDDLHAHELAVAQLEAAAVAAERLDRVCAGLEARLERIAVHLAMVDALDALAPVAVGPGQLALVVGG